MRAARPSLINASRPDTKAAISPCVGRGSAAGGISPEFTRSTISAHWCASISVRKFRESVSIRSSPCSSPGPWQRTQCLSRNRSKLSPARALVSEPLPGPLTTSSRQAWRMVSRGGMARKGMTGNGAGDRKGFAQRQQTRHRGHRGGPHAEYPVPTYPLFVMTTA